MRSAPSGMQLWKITACERKPEDMKGLARMWLSRNSHVRLSVWGDAGGIRRSVVLHRTAARDGSLLCGIVHA